MKFIILYIIIVIIKAATITYDYGFENRFDYIKYPNFTCYNSQSYTQTTNFRGTFAKIPKLIITDTYYDMIKNGFEEFIFTVVSTLTDFTVTVACPQTQVYTLFYNWTAIDDERIEVITIANKNMTNEQSQIFTFPHSNPNALQGYISLTSFGTKGALIINLEVKEYNIQIVKITTDSVEVKYTTGNSNCYQIGYQIILATKHSLTQTASLFNHLAHSPLVKYESGTLTKPQGQKLFTPLSGMSSPYTDNLRVRCNQSETITTISYFWEICNIEFQILGQFSDQDIYHKQVWLSLPVTETFYPMVHKKTLVKKLYNPLNDKMRLTILKPLKVFMLVSDSADLLIDCNLDMVIYFQCGYSQKIQGQVLICPTCNRQNYYINDICHMDFNEVTYFITYQKQDAAYQKININITSQGFTVTQTVFNQVSEQYILLKLEISDIIL